MDNILVAMSILIVCVLLILVVTSLSRLKIPRDASKEGIDDIESIMAYDRVMQWHIFSLVRYLFIYKLKKHRPHGRLMDAGCGPGYLALTLAKTFPKLDIVGVDKSEMMLELAKRNQSAARQSRVKFLEADIQKLPFECNYLDFVISTLSLHHWINSQQAMEEIYRVLTPGGQFFIFDTRRDMPRMLYYLVYGIQRFLAPPPIRRVNGGVGSIWSSYTPVESEVLLAKTPFRNWKVQKRWGWCYIWGKK